jgi:signal peptidase II
MLALWVSITIAVLDQFVKCLVRARFSLHGGVVVVPGLFDLRYVRNTGAAWGIFADGTHWLALLSVVVLGLLVRFRHSFLPPGVAGRLVLGLLAGGIVGNLIDRVRLNYVVDYLDFYWRGHHFPAFNIADAAICIGVGVYLALHLRTGTVR